MEPDITGENQSFRDIPWYPMKTYLIVKLIQILVKISNSFKSLLVVKLYKFPVIVNEHLIPVKLSL